MNKALIIVDVQQDFCPGGALPAPRGNDIIPVINQLATSFHLVLASKDWHPESTVHFDKWPVHCVQGTPGAAFHPNLEESAIDVVAIKGTGNIDDGYSAFEATNMDVAGWLKDNKIEKIYVCGLTTEYCVKATAFDALKGGFEVYVITDAVAAVAAHANDEENALQELKTKGVRLVTSAEV